MFSDEYKSLDGDQLAIVEKYLNDYPVKLGSLAHELGVVVKVAKLPTGVSGQISNESGQYTIRVNRNEARERQRFTIAHELSHFLLHRDIIDASPDGITDTVLYRSGASERIEYQANRLAADLVMPLNMVNEKLQNDYDDIVIEAAIESLAASFQVSKAAMEIRLSTLN